MQQQQRKKGQGVPMINSFLNLCRVCPVTTDDKVNSEYKRNFTWHDGYQAAKAEVVKKAPSTPNSSAEPHLSRKKRQPESAHRTHELLFDYEEGESSDSLETGGGAANLGLALDKAELDARARSEERSTGKSKPSPRSRSADSTVSRRPRTVALMTQSYPPTSNPRGNPGTPGSGDEGIPKTTEYRSQYVAYPRTDGEAVSTARKSASMGLITPHAAKKDVADKDGEIVTGDAWSIRPAEEADDDDAALDAVKRGRIKKTEYKAKFKPFSAYTYVDGSWKKSTRLIKDVPADDSEMLTCSIPPLFGDYSDHEMPSDADPNAWYTEVLERLKKADMYKVRSNAGAPLYGEQQFPPELIPYVRDLDRTLLSSVSVASTSRPWKDERPSKEKNRPAPVGVHRKEKRDAMDSPDQPKSREGSTKKKATSESKPAVRPKSAEPVISPLKGEHKSPKHQPRTAGSRPRAPKDLPVHGHGDLSGKKKAPRQGTASPHGRHVDKASPVGSKPRAVPRPAGGLGVLNGEDGKVWLKSEAAGADQEDGRETGKSQPGGSAVNGMLPPESSVNGYLGSDKSEPMVNGEADDSVRQKLAEDTRDGEIRENGLEPSPRPITKPPMRVPLTTVKSPEEVTGVRSPDPETWTVPLEIGKGLQWMDGKTPDCVQQKTVPLIFSKRFKESSLAGKVHKDLVVGDPGSAHTGESVDL